MGSLIIRRISYVGDKYIFESPEFSTGINVIVGDNGSGKSTLSYMIEYALGGDISYFKIDGNEKYKEISQDKNNYILLSIQINKKEYELKRFIGTNDIIIKDGHSFKTYPIIRKNNAVFSDWLLEKLDIEAFELALGAINWRFNFNDLARLLIYDQSTEPKKIYKNPSKENFITDSSLIRKTIFETLVGLSSKEYTSDLGHIRKLKEEQEISKSILQHFTEVNATTIQLKLNLDEEKLKLKELVQQYDSLLTTREESQNSSFEIDDKSLYISELQSRLIDLQIENSNCRILRHKLEVESGNTSTLLSGLENEINQIVKIIHTNDKLNLFSLECCPFCGNPNTHEEGTCICGQTLNDNEYRKFVYNSNEYKVILDSKRKRIATIVTAVESFKADIEDCEKHINHTQEEIDDVMNKITVAISAIKYTDNSIIIDSCNDEIFKVKAEIQEQEDIIEILSAFVKLQDDYNSKNNNYKDALKAHKTVESQFNIDNESIINEFNSIYAMLMKQSSLSLDSIEINENYIPIIDSGYYKEKSSSVPIRLIYYFTLFYLGLSKQQVKHPRFMLIDTPEEAGIDTPNLKMNLELLTIAIDELVEKQSDIGDYQVIITSGEDKYPDSWRKYRKLRFSKTENIFILKDRSY